MNGGPSYTTFTTTNMKVNMNDSSDSDSSSNSSYSSQEGENYSYQIGGDQFENLPTEIQEQIGNAINMTFNMYGNQESQPNEEEYSNESENDSPFEEEYELNPDYEGEVEEVTEKQRNEIINSYSMFKFEEQKQEKTCSVCQDKLKQGQFYKILNCKHMFHSKCINTWLKQRLICPLCKTKIT